MKKILTLILFLVELICEASNDFDRLPKPPVNYRYFAVEFEDSYRILGSCSEVKKTSPKSRCILRITHNYSPKFVASEFSENTEGTGTIIQKSIDNGIRSIIILTAFHTIVPQTNLTFRAFLGYNSAVILLIVLPLIIYVRRIDRQHLKKFVLFFSCYSFMSSCIVYCVIVFMHSVLFNSLFQLTLLSDDNRLIIESSQIQCEMKSSKMFFFVNWWDDIG